MRFSSAAMFTAVTAICIALAFTVANCSEYQRAFSREDRHLFDIIGVFHKYCIVWLTAFAASLCVAANVRERQYRMITIAFAIYAFAACAVNFVLPFGAL